MHWQDIVISVGQYIFVIALIPSITGKDKPALSTSLLTASIIGVIAITYATLNLWGSFFSAMILATAWAILAWQKYSMQRREKDRII